MKTRHHISVIFLALCSLFFASPAAQPQTPIPLPTISSTSGAWIGYGEHKCFRLELDEDGTGYLAMAGLLDNEGRFIPNVGKIHRIASWLPNGYRIEADLQPLTKGEEKIVLTNNFLGRYSMDMELEVSQGGSKYKVTLYKEKELRARTEKLREGIDTFRKKG